MEMFLMVVCMSLFALGVTAAAFGAATREDEPAGKPAMDPAAALPKPQFFKDYTVSPLVTQPQVPIEALLLQIENHIRLEQAAAESFLEMPTPALLHSKTISTLVQ